MNNMKYKTFTWPYNPSTFTLSCEKKIVIHEYPEIDNAENEELGIKPRTLSGSGVFFGPNAYKNFSALSKIYYHDKTPGQLYHPKYGQFTATFSKFTAKEEALENYVEYDFEFVEYKNIGVLYKMPVTSSNSSSNSDSSSSKTSTRYYVTVSKDSLWKIAVKYYKDGNQWKKIADANKSLLKGNPNLIMPGWKLVIPY